MVQYFLRDHCLERDQHLKDNLNFCEKSTTNRITGIYNVTQEYREFFKFEKMIKGNQFRI